MELILASKSPRRKEILEKFGYKFIVAVSDEKEIIPDNAAPCEIVKSIALQKASSVYERLADKSEKVVVGADTIVVLDGKILLKPKDNGEEEAMLKSLSGRAHKVFTGFAVICENKVISDYDESVVYFNKLSDKTINDYVLSGLGLDKAGGYGVQDDYNLVKNVEGSYYNVVGLPIEKIKEYFNELGL